MNWGCLPRLSGENSPLSASISSSPIQYEFHYLLLCSIRSASPGPPRARTVEIKDDIFRIFLRMLFGFGAGDNRKHHGLCISQLLTS